MPILGNGDIARVLPEREDLLFFASGVSNSQEILESAYQREVDLLAEQDRDVHIVYFSSLAVLNGTSRYVQHKRSMEGRIKEFDHNTIVRIGNIAFGDNPNTLINHIKNSIAKEEEFRIEDVYRVNEIIEGKL